MDHAAGLSPQPTQPTVEFGTDMVIAAFMGSRSTGGYVITVEDVRENDEFIIVEIEMETPGSGCDVTDGVTQPHHMVVLPDGRFVPEVAIRRAVHLIARACAVIEALPAETRAALEEEVRRLKRENERMREEREILKKATAFFARTPR